MTIRTRITASALVIASAIMLSACSAPSLGGQAVTAPTSTSVDLRPSGNGGLTVPTVSSGTLASGQITVPSSTSTPTPSVTSSSGADDTSVPLTTAEEATPTETTTAPSSTTSSASSSSSSATTTPSTPKTTVTKTVPPYKGPEWCLTDGGFDHNDQINEKLVVLHQKGKTVVTLALESNGASGTEPIFMAPSLPYMRTNVNGSAITYGRYDGLYGAFGWVQALNTSPNPTTGTLYNDWQEVNFIDLTPTRTKTSPLGDTSVLLKYPDGYAALSGDDLNLIAGPMYNAWQSYKTVWHLHYNAPTCPQGVN